MKGNFLTPPPPLNQAFESGSGSSGPANGITRRSFLKRTGAASVATLVAWNMGSGIAQAEGEEEGGSSFLMTCTEPIYSSYAQIADDEVARTENYTLHLEVFVKQDATDFKKNLLDYDANSGTQLTARLTYRRRTAHPGGPTLYRKRVNDDFPNRNEYPDCSTTLEKYVVVVNVINGNITRTEKNPVSILGVDSNNWAEWLDLERVAVGGDGNSTTHAVLYCIKLRVHGTITLKSAGLTQQMPHFDKTFSIGTANAKKILFWWEGHPV